MRPDNVAAVEKGETIEAALNGALAAVERQVREYRNKLRERWKPP
jgi:ribosome-associated translation inhibitor RaiA